MANQQATHNGIPVIVVRGHADKTVDLATEDGVQTWSRVNPKDVVLTQPAPAPVEETKVLAARAKTKKTVSKPSKKRSRR